LRPRLVGAAKVRFSDSKSGVEETRDIVLAAEFPAGLGGVDWAGAEAPDAAPGDFVSAAPDAASFAALPAAASLAKNFPAWEKDFVRWVADNEKCEVLKCPALSLNSKPGESRADFMARAALAQREFRDGKVADLKKKYTPKLAAIEARISRAEVTVQKQKDQARNANVQTAISVGTTILGALFGRKAFSASTISKAGTAARGASRAMREGADVAHAEESVEGLQAERARLDGDFAAESASLTASLQDPAIESAALKPARGGIIVQLFGLGWI
ncbi:MAG: ATP-binding protein, partial [Verrucomicrobiota bacterium]